MRTREPIYLRGGVWWCRVRDRRGKIVRKSTGCRDLEAARRAWRELERIAADPAHAAASETKLVDAVRAYQLELQRRKRSADTLKVATQKAGHFLRIWKEDMPLSGIDAALVNDYIAQRESEKVSATKYVTPHTIKKELQALKGILDVARHLGRFHREVHLVLPLHYGAKYRPKKRAPSPEELRALLEQFHERRAAHLAFFAATGARLGEARRARREDLRPHEVYLRGTKTEGSDRVIPITRLSRPLLEWALAHAPGKDVLFHPWGKLHRDVEAGCVRAGIAKVTPNDLRRAFATWHRKAGVDVTDIAALLGHTTDKLAQTTYAHIGGEDLGAVIDRVLAGVPNMYLTAGSDRTNGCDSDDDTSEKQAPPAEIESATSGLGSRLSESARSAGNKAAWARRKAALVAGSVPILDADVSAENEGEPPSGCPVCGGAHDCVAVVRFRDRAHAWLTRRAA